MAISRLSGLSLHNEGAYLACQGEDPMKTIWVNEQMDPSGLLYACIACCNEQQAQDCNQSFNENLTLAQRAAGWFVRMRQVSSWDDVPASALKLD
jgi:hypothetical protein